MKIFSRFVLCFVWIVPLCVQAQNISKMSVEQLQNARDSLYVLRNYTMSQEYAKYAKENSELITFTFISPKTIDSYLKSSDELRKAKTVYESVSEDLHACLMKNAAYNAKYNKRFNKRDFITLEDENSQEVKNIAKTDPEVNRLWQGKQQLLIIYHCTAVRVISEDYLKNKRVFSVDWIPAEGLSMVNSKTSVRLLNRKLLSIERKLSKSN